MFTFLLIILGFVLVFTSDIRAAKKQETQKKALQKKWIKEYVDSKPLPSFKLETIEADREKVEQELGLSSNDAWKLLATELTSRDKNWC
ncbi:MAG: hypothetical protein PHN35_07135 [Clostridia bacterium]|mgnify:CR=1 FL=1|nr:hypothetical protein [Clostridia bacterium]